MEVTTNPPCNTSLLDVYTPSGQNPWTSQKIKHLYRRMAYGVNLAGIDAALPLTPSALIDTIVDAAVSLDPTPAPPWGYFSISDFTDFDTENPNYIEQWYLQTANDTIEQSLRAKLTMFWMNHFVTELESYTYAPYMFQYYNLMQTHALGNFKEFVRAVGVNSTMLVYLNGFENTSNNPNENYARELFELFTLGENNNYTQQDILEASRALTGYNHWDDPGAQIYFDQSTWDEGPKTIFGSEEFYTYDELIDTLFELRETEIAQFICTKLYKYFVSHEYDAITQEDIINPLAQTLIDVNFEMAPMLRQLFKSQHFFDERAFGVVIKSPYDVVFNYINEGNFFYDDRVLQGLIYYTGIIGQEIYNPPDVSGWQRDQDWINTATLSGRWQIMELFNGYLFDLELQAQFIDLAIELSSDSNDPYEITKAVVDFFNSKELFTQEDYQTATSVLKWEIPQNYYDDGIWSLNYPTAPYQVFLLLNHMTKLPEFQLK
tara:strand:- start:2333 stop:3802 length:1470 start_codon:yes stop_codon:yes gene_type:complete